MLTLRVRALYRNVRWAVWLLWLAFALFHGLRLLTLLWGEAAYYREVSSSQLYQRTDIAFAEHIKYSPINRTCEVAHVGNSSGAFMGLAGTLFDLLLLVLTAFKALRGPTSLESNRTVCIESW